jgi:hypothetical protein
MKALTSGPFSHGVGRTGKTPPHPRPDQHWFRPEVLASYGKQLLIGGKSLQHRRSKQSVLILAQLERAPSLPLGTVLIMIKKGEIGLPIAETNRHRRKCQQLFDNLLAKLQTAEETILTNPASGFIGIHILNQRLSGSWQRLGVP